MARYIDAVQCADIISEKLNIPLGDLVDVFAEIPTADVVEVKDCEKCEHFDKHSTQPICISCSNRYTNNFKPKRSDA
jgi:predicted hydrocarbon binding protein